MAPHFILCGSFFCIDPFECWELVVAHGGIVVRLQQGEEGAYPTLSVHNCNKRCATEWFYVTNSEWTCHYFWGIPSYQRSWISVPYMEGDVDVAGACSWGLTGVDIAATFITHQVIPLKAWVYPLYEDARNNDECILYTSIFVDSVGPPYVEFYRIIAKFSPSGWPKFCRSAGGVGWK